MNNGGLSARTLHLNGLVGGQGRVFQGSGVEAGSVLHTGVSVGGRRSTDRRGGVRCRGGDERLADEGEERKETTGKAAK